MRHHPRVLLARRRRPENRKGPVVPIAPRLSAVIPGRDQGGALIGPGSRLCSEGGRFRSRGRWRTPSRGPTWSPVFGFHRPGVIRLLTGKTGISYRARFDLWCGLSKGYPMGFVTGKLKTKVESALSVLKSFPPGGRRRIRVGGERDRLGRPGRGDPGRTRRLPGMSDSQGGVRRHAFVPTELRGDGVLRSYPGLSLRSTH